MDDTEKLLSFSLLNFLQGKIYKSFPRVTVKDIILEYEKFDILDFLEGDDLFEKIQKILKIFHFPQLNVVGMIIFFIFLK